MPHNFVKINAMTPNPGLRRRKTVKTVVEERGGKFLNLWFDDLKNPTYAYVLFKDGNLEKILDELHGLEVIRLNQAP